MGAYWLLHEHRSAAPKRSIWRTATFETIRCTFLKIAARIQELKTRIKIGAALNLSERSNLDRARHLNRRLRSMSDAASAALALANVPASTAVNPADVMRSHRQSPAPTNNWG